MTQEKQLLLLKDLCARLPYEVKGRVYAETTYGEYDINGDMIFFDSPFDVTLDDINTSTEEIHVIAIGNEDTVDFIEGQQIDGKPYTIDEFKPYLRPMSSMTEKEYKEFCKISGLRKKEEGNYFSNHLPEWGNSIITEMVMVRTIDWLNSHHFDYRGLIENGLAIEAPKDMYKID